jgi:hypothetical protein
VERRNVLCEFCRKNPATCSVSSDGQRRKSFACDSCCSYGDNNRTCYPFVDLMREQITEISKSIKIVPKELAP